MIAWQQITNSQRISTVIVCSAWTDIPHEHYHETVWDMARLQTRDFYGASVCDWYGSVCLLLVCLKCQHSLLRWLDDDVDFVRVLPFDLSKAFDTLRKCFSAKSWSLRISIHQLNYQLPWQTQTEGRFGWKHYWLCWYQQTDTSGHSPWATFILSDGVRYKASRFKQRDLEICQWHHH